MTTVVQTGARLHLTLLDLGRATSRVYGGAGFMIEGPQTAVQASVSDSWQVTYESAAEPRTQLALLDLIEQLRSQTDKAATIHVSAMAFSHVGLGAKTSLVLATATAVGKELGIHLSERHLQTLSGRGGTSGIGVNGFFRGGFLIDCGHDGRTVNEFGPSSTRRPSGIPSVTCHLPIPSNWRFGLFLFPAALRLHASAESTFFAKNTPVPKAEVFEVISIVYHDIWSAVRESRLDLLGCSLQRVHQLGFKCRELMGQSDPVRDLYTALSSAGHPAGLSSLGPTIYVVEDDPRRLGQAMDLAERAGASFLGDFGGVHAAED